MAYQNAEGNSPPTGMSKTPAPTRPAAPDVVSKMRQPSAQGAGMNGPLNPSSIDPGKQLLSPLAANLKASVDDDGVLDNVIAKGTHMDLGWQTRSIGDKNVPVHPGTKSAAPSGKVPTKLGEAASAPV